MLESICLMTSILLVPPTATALDDSAQIKQLMTAQVAAWNRGDLEGFMDTYWKSEKLTFSAGGNTTRGWQATWDRYRRRYPDKKTMGQLTFSDLEFTQLGPAAALVLGKWKLKREQDTPHGNFSVVMQKLDGKWVIIHDHSSSLEE